MVLHCALSTHSEWPLGSAGRDKLVSCSPLEKPDVMVKVKEKRFAFHFANMRLEFTRFKHLELFIAADK